MIKKQMKKKRKNLESAMQSDFFYWLSIFHPEYRPYCFAIPNGGSRNIIEAANLKRQGVTSGVPDVMCCIPIDGFHGLFIEFKSGKNKLTDNQRKMILRLSESSYKCAVCYSFESSVEDFKEYVGI